MRKDLAQDEAQEHQYDGCAFTTAICPGLEEEEEDSIQRILGGGVPQTEHPQNDHVNRGSCPQSVGVRMITTYSSCDGGAWRSQKAPSSLTTVL